MLNRIEGELVTNASQRKCGGTDSDVRNRQKLGSMFTSHGAIAFTCQNNSFMDNFT